jgi:hypothetical protein
MTIIDPDEDAADEALWDEQFAKSQDVLDFLAREGLEEYYAGLTDDFDPDNDPDAKWDEMLTNSKDKLAKLAEKARQEHHAGKTKRI